MSLPLSLGCLWVLLSAITAMMPMRYQYVPGVALLLAAPALLWWLAIEHGFGLMLFGLFAFVSMFRNPLIYFWRRARGEQVEVFEVDFAHHSRVLGVGVRVSTMYTIAC